MIWKIKVVHTIPQGMNPTVNVLARLVIELSYYDVGVHYASHYPVRNMDARVVKKVLSLIQILNLSHTSHPCMCLIN